MTEDPFEVRFLQKRQESLYASRLTPYVKQGAKRKAEVNMQEDSLEAHG
jgi:hypothetical protein